MSKYKPKGSNDIRSFITDRLPTSLSNRVRLLCDEECIEFLLDDKLYKRFYSEELINYERPFFCKYHEQTQQKMQMMKGKSVTERDVYDADDLEVALNSYLQLKIEDILASDNPLIFFLALFDKNIDLSMLDTDVMEKHTWLKIIYDFRAFGRLPKEYYDRDVVTLDFRFCDGDFDPYYVMRREMKWFYYFGDGLDALWDILTGMPFFGDDFIIKRLKKHSYTDRYGEHDFTRKVDGICMVFERAVEKYGKYTDMTVRIEYYD